MKKMKTWLRTSMLQNRFINISIIHIEKEISEIIDVNEILSMFAKKIDIYY